LDDLFKDYKNRKILIVDAIYVIKNQINGASPDDISKVLLFLRSGKSLDSFNNYMIRIPGNPFGGYIEFP